MTHKHAEENLIGYNVFGGFPYDEIWGDANDFR